MDGLGLVGAGLTLIAIGMWMQFKKRARDASRMSLEWRHDELPKHEQRQRKGHALW
jgi:hypothetical protein